MSNNDLLERKEYLLGITIIEGRNFLGKDADGTSDPFVKIKCANQVQQTSKKYDVNSATWNQSITFAGLMMNQYELETFELNLEVYDHNAVLANELIGQYSIGLSTLYTNLNHEFYKHWVGVFNRENPNIVQGYLQFSCFIVGPNERPPVHSQDEDFGDEEEQDSEEDDEAIARKIESIKRVQGIMQVLNPSKIDKSFQMTVIVSKAEGLPKIDGKCAPFVSARVFGCVLTTPVGRNNNPKFNAKLQFPIFYPILNNKITMRLWHKTGAMSANVFLANIPEHPSPLDQFNITKLKSQDGRMKPRWFNVYGVHPELRSDKTKSKKEGSMYLGRVLLSFNLVSNERPQLQEQTCNPINEPKEIDYQLCVDLYSLIECELVSGGDPVWLRISLGNRETEKVELQYKQKTNSYKYKKITVSDKNLVELTFPADVSQVPDIFVNFYKSAAFSQEHRFGYLRIKVSDCLSLRSRPSWFRLKSPYNNTGSKNIGSMMCNFQMRKYNKAKPLEREAIQKSGKKKAYKFYFHILNGFELASMIKSENLKTSVELKVGTLKSEKE